jgi:hypothetical protein
MIGFGLLSATPLFAMLFMGHQLRAAAVFNTPRLSKRLLARVVFAMLYVTGVIQGCLAPVFTAMIIASWGNR